MRMYMNIIIAAIVLHYAAFAQELAPSILTDGKISCDQSCIDKEAPYQFCDTLTKKFVIKCSRNPNNEPGFKPLKKRMPPSCIQYYRESLTFLNPDEGFVQIKRDPANGTLDTLLLFAPIYVGSSVESLPYDWWFKSGCPPQSEGLDTCCLNVRWITDDFEMREFTSTPGTTLAVQYTSHIPVAGGNKTCGVSCERTEIVLNASPGFRQDTNGVPRRFFYNYLEPEDNGFLENDASLEYYHFNSVLLHEIGHWYGLGHAGKPDSYGRTCGQDQGVMQGGMDPGDEFDLSQATDDLCAFKKLYCCAQTVDVEEENNELFKTRFEIFPNPAVASSVQIRLPEKFALGQKFISIVDNQGKIVSKQTISNNSSEFVLNISQIPNGEYMIIVSFANYRGSISQKVIILR